MPDHVIRLRAGWKAIWVDDAGRETREILALPFDDSSRPPFAGPVIRLVRSFQRPPVNPDIEAIWLRIADSPGLIALKLNGSPIDGTLPPIQGDFERPLQPLLSIRNELEMVVDRVEAAKQENWGRVSLIIRGNDSSV